MIVNHLSCRVILRCRYLCFVYRFSPSCYFFISIQKLPWPNFGIGSFSSINCHHNRLLTAPIYPQFLNSQSSVIRISHLYSCFLCPISSPLLFLGNQMSQSLQHYSQIKASPMNTSSNVFFCSCRPQIKANL